MIGVNKVIFLFDILYGLFIKCMTVSFRTHAVGEFMSMFFSIFIFTLRKFHGRDYDIACMCENSNNVLQDKQYWSLR